MYGCMYPLFNVDKGPKETEEKKKENELSSLVDRTVVVFVFVFARKHGIGIPDTILTIYVHVIC